MVLRIVSDGNGGCACWVHGEGEGAGGCGGQHMWDSSTSG